MPMVLLIHVFLLHAWESNVSVPKDGQFSWNLVSFLLVSLLFHGGLINLCISLADEWAWGKQNLFTCLGLVGTLLISSCIDWNESLGMGARKVAGGAILNRRNWNKNKKAPKCLPYSKKSCLLCLQNWW